MGLATVAPSRSRTSLRLEPEVLRFACLGLHTLPKSFRHSAGIEVAEGSAGFCFSEGACGLSPSGG
jgi:hypothetical protein